MGRLLNIWRSWSVPARLAVIGGAVAVVAGAAAAAYLVTKRPADVSNPQAVFHKQKRPKKKVETLNWPLSETTYRRPSCMRTARAPRSGACRRCGYGDP